MERLQHSLARAEGPHSACSGRGATGERRGTVSAGTASLVRFKFSCSNSRGNNCLFRTLTPTIVSLQAARPALCSPEPLGKNTPTAANHASNLGPAAAQNLEGKHSQPSQPTATTWEPLTRDSRLHRRWIVFKGPCLVLMPLLMAVEMHEPFRLPNKRMLEMAHGTRDKGR